MTRSEGWIAALQTAALSMRGRENVSEFVSSFNGSHTHITKYLTQEVFLHQTLEIQSFLLKTSFLDRLSGPLCNAVTGRHDCHQILVQLDTANLFIVPLDDEQYWYRYHPLFADFLKKRTSIHFPEQANDIHKKAGKWYEQNNSINEAIQHALAGKDFECAARLMVRYGMDMFSRGERSTIQQWLRMLPEETIRNFPVLCIAHAAVLLPDRNAVSTIEKRLQDAEKAFAHNTKASKDQKSFDFITAGRINYYIVAVRAHLARESGESPEKIIALSNKVISTFPKEDTYSPGFLLLNLFAAHMLKNDYKTAAKLMDEKKSMIQGSANYIIIIFAAYLQAWIAQAEGKLNKASGICRERVLSGFSTKLTQVRTFLEDQLQTTEKRGLNSVSIEIYILLALMYQVHNDHKQVLLIGKALTIAEPEGYKRFFIDEGQPMARLLRKAISHDIQPKYANHLYAAIKKESRSSDQSDQQKSSIKSLSAREQEVHHLLAVGLSNQEMADELFIARETVKTHLTNIYRKLDITKRVQAVTFAKNLNTL